MILRHIAKKIVLYTACLLFILYGGSGSADARVLRLKTQTLTTTPNAAAYFSSVAKSTGDTLEAIIQFNSTITLGDKENYAIKGVKLLNYLPDNAYTAIIYPQRNLANSDINNIYSVTNVEPIWKIDEHTQLSLTAHEKKIKIAVSFHPFVAKEQIVAYCNALNIGIDNNNVLAYNTYKIETDYEAMTKLAAWYGVEYISTDGERVALDLQSNPVVKVNVATLPIARGGYGLSGDSVAVAVGDNGSGAFHVDTKDRVVSFHPAKVQKHGSLVNGLVGGAGTLDPVAIGMAPLCKLIDYSFDQVITHTPDAYTDYNATITNNSYAVMVRNCAYSATYDVYSRYLDSIALQYPYVLHVFASGNDGWMSCSPMPKGYGTVSGGYQPAKNNMTVGSITDYLYQAEDEGRGPCRDGRIKPDMVAVGLRAYTCFGIDIYDWAAGTSIASPHVAGGAALLTQRYKQLNGGRTPRADVLKAILLNGAMDIGNKGPDFCYGFGVLDVLNSVKIIDSNRVIEDSILNSGVKTYTLRLPPNTAQLKVLITWQESPANLLSATQLVNDLDMTLSTPTGSVRYPFILSKSPDSVTLPAREGEDHVNNTEQIVIDNPTAGSYTLTIRGTRVTTGNQKYAITYLPITKGITLTHPAGGSACINTDTLRVFWNASPDTTKFNILFSSNGGSSWTNIANNLPATEHYFAWMPAGITSGRCLIRLVRNSIAGEVATSPLFAINSPPKLGLAANQCPGYINFHWSPVAGATAYCVYLKKGYHLQAIDTVADTSYIAAGVPTDQKLYIAVSPMFNSIEGYRSNALMYTADTGSCAMMPITNGDLALKQIRMPIGGRQNTSMQLGSSETMTVVLRNLYANACSRYSILYKVNMGSWQTYTPSTAIPANDTLAIPVPGLNLSALGTYSITVAVKNLSLTDPITGNDTLSYTLNNVPNDTVSLPYLDNFEDLNKVELRNPIIGFTPNARWDFETKDSLGRLRSYVNPGVTFGGNRSISLDEAIPVSVGSKNRLTGTFNLAGKDTALHEVRIDFDYLLHGIPLLMADNGVFARGNDRTAWMPIYSYDYTSYAGTLLHARSLSLTDILRSQRVNFSTSTQLQFAQSDTSLIADYNYGNGITIDNVKLYTVTNDAVLEAIVSPLPTLCGAPISQSLTIKVKNGVNYTLRTINVFYKDSTGTYTGVIDSIAPKATVNYTFSHPISLPQGASRHLDVWLSLASDSYLLNDSILNYECRNNKIVNTYPYIENFEKTDGAFYTGGYKSSWQYGTPRSTTIKNAASGMRAWKTNLTGKYNNLEKSYLYSPCFDIEALNSPMLSFSAAMEVEDCGKVLCDEAYMEYTLDGYNWHKLGNSGAGTNWYDSMFNAWSTFNKVRWQVTSIPLPKPAPGQMLQLRFVLSADPGVTFDGLAIDDIHLFDRDNSILQTNSYTTLTRDLSPNQWNNFSGRGGILLSLLPTKEYANAEATLYSNALSNPGKTQYTLGNSYSIDCNSFTADSILMRLYITDSALIRCIADTTCPTCDPLSDIYHLGITNYYSPQHPLLENGTLEDDSVGIATFIPHNNITYVPQDNGYYAEIKFNQLGEYWFNTGGPTANVPATIDYVSFSAFKAGNDVHLYWTSPIDTAIARYYLERSTDGTAFAGILDTPATNLTNTDYAHIEAGEFPAVPYVYYRLKWTLKGQSDTFASAIRLVSDSDNTDKLFKFNATQQSQSIIFTQWQVLIDPAVRNYQLYRSVDNGAFSLLNERNARGVSNQKYSYFDNIQLLSSQNALLTYKLVAYLKTGDTLIAPLKTLRVGTENTVFSLYPNPVDNGSITIEWAAEPGSRLLVNIKDITGRQYASATDVATRFRNTTAMQVETLPKGIYLIEVVINGKKTVGKIVIE